jgi:hypothetical protein
MNSSLENKQLYTNNLSSETKELYKINTPPPFNTLGLFTFLRTYARRHDENDPHSTIESWDQTLIRIVEACNSQLKVGFTNEEKSEIFQLFYNLKCSVAGRFLWQLGTKTVDNLGIPSLQNCATVVIDEPIVPFTWAMNLLMLGCVPPNTFVQTEKGPIKIKDIKVGDLVWSYNLETKEKELKEVLKLHDPIVKKEENIKINCKYGSLITSKKHPVLVYENDNWVFKLAGEIKEGDILQRLTFYETKEEVISLETNLDIDEKWKDISVDANNNYYCGVNGFALYNTHNCGIGFRILPEDVDKLPEVKYAKNLRLDTKDADYIVPDSREGWVKLLGKILKSHFYSGQSFTYSCSCLRSKGAPIKSFGGLASGPDVLCDGITKIDEILNKRMGQKLRPVDALDIMCCIGEIVVSGNVRRCLPGNALVHTENGLIPIKDIKVKQKVLTSKGYFPVKNVFEQGKQKLVKIKTENGLFYSTKNHRMAVVNKDDKNYIWKQAGDLNSNDYLVNSSESIKGNELHSLPSFGGFEIPTLTPEIAYLWGFLQVYHKIWSSSKIISFDRKDKELSEKIKEYLSLFENKKIDVTEVYDNIILHYDSDFFFEYFSNHISKQEVPRFILESPDEIRKSYLKGIFQTVEKDQVRYFISESFTRQLQTLFASIGCNVKFSQSEIMNNLYFLKVEEDVFEEKQNNTFCSRVISITEEGNNEVETYDIEVEEVHEFFCDGYLTHNSALIAQGDCKDIHYLNAKRWDLGNVPNCRAFSNNSVICNDINEVLETKEFWDGYYGNGEPYGLINLKLSQSCGRLGDFRYKDEGAVGYNPCFSEDTKIMLADGKGTIKTIKELADEGKDVPVYCMDEKNNVEVKWGRNPRITGENKKLYRVHFRGKHKGEYVDVTKDHKFIVNGQDEQVLTKDLKKGDSIPMIKRELASDGYVKLKCKGGKSSVEHRLIAQFHDPEAFEELKINGMMNGCCATENVVVHHIDEDKSNNEIENLEIMTFGDHDSHHGKAFAGENNPMYGKNHTNETKKKIGDKSKERWQTQEFKDKIAETFTEERKEHLSEKMKLQREEEERARSIEYEEECKRTGLRFIRLSETKVEVVKECLACKKDFQIPFTRREQAYCSHSCSNTKPSSIEARTKGLRAVNNEKSKNNFHNQVMLFRELVETKGDRNKVMKKEWESLCRERKVPFRFQSKSTNEWIPRNWGHFKDMEENYNHEVDRVEKLPGRHTVYNITVDDNHNLFIVTGEFKTQTRGVIIPQCGEQTLFCKETCCLSEIYLPNINSYEELVKCATYLYRICKHSLRLPFKGEKATEDIVHKNMRMGIGVTGYLQASEEQRSWLKNCYEHLRKFDENYSKLHSFPTSIKITTCKPSGTLSILGGCTSGVHPAFAQYYKRRIRISSESPLINLAKKNGYDVEYARNFDGTQNHGTQIITFPYKMPEGTVLAENCSAVQQLEWVKRLQTEWSDNAVSVTVYYRKHELEEIKEWLKENYNNNVKTVSFLLHNDHGFDQAPLEQITKEEYEEMVKRTKPIESVEGICYYKESDESIKEMECAGGSCPIR